MIILAFFKVDDRISLYNALHHIFLFCLEQESSDFPNKGPVHCPSDFRKPACEPVSMDINNTLNLMVSGSKNAPGLVVSESKNVLV